MPWEPLSDAIADGVKTFVTSPDSLCIRTRLPSLTAMPAASWPRCCRANRPKNTVWATPSPCGVDTPNTPHSSCGESSNGRTRTGSADMGEHLLDAWTDGVLALHERQPGEPFVGVDVARRRRRPHLR